MQNRLFFWNLVYIKLARRVRHSRSSPRTGAFHGQDSRYRDCPEYSPSCPPPRHHRSRAHGIGPNFFAKRRPAPFRSVRTTSIDGADPQIGIPSFLPRLSAPEFPGPFFAEGPNLAATNWLQRQNGATKPVAAWHSAYQTCANASSRTREKSKAQLRHAGTAGSYSRESRICADRQRLLRSAIIPKTRMPHALGFRTIHV